MCRFTHTTRVASCCSSPGWDLRAPETDFFFPTKQGRVAPCSHAIALGSLTAGKSVALRGYPECSCRSTEFKRCLSKDQLSEVHLTRFQIKPNCVCFVRPSLRADPLSYVGTLPNFTPALLRSYPSSIDEFKHAKPPDPLTEGQL